MPELDEAGSSSTELARRGLLITLILAMTGSCLGLVGAVVGVVHGVEILLTLSSSIFSASSLILLLFFRRVAAQTIATSTTLFFFVNLSAGMVITTYGPGDHLNLFVYLVWFFPLLVFNKLVNQPAIGRLLGKILQTVPILFVGCLLPRLMVVLPKEQLMLLTIYCLSYLCYGVMLNVVTRYREAYIVERERAESLRVEITNRKEAEARIQHLAYFDTLTGLPNLLLLRERLEGALSRAVHRGNMGAVLFIDLNDFKTLNDTLGHETGDLLLKQVSMRLSACVRKSDTLARLGGDVFVVVLEGLSEDFEMAAVEARLSGEKILKAFGQSYSVGNYEYDSTTSIGITVFPAWSDSVDDILKRGDLAIQKAKAQGRNTLCFFDPEMQTSVASRAQLQSDLRRALHNCEFEVHYQPQVNSDGYVTGAEALLRWEHPLRGMVPPGEFIPLAEESGFIVEVGCWVLETACAQLAEWAKRPEMEHLTVSVNVSIRQFLDSNFVTSVRSVLQTSGVNPQRLKLEITESTVIEKVDEMIAKMTALKASGVGFSLDDFGTGHSSLAHLKRLPLDQLKIDRSFVTDVLTNIKDASIARTIITLGQCLNLSVIAEGVETDEQRDFLKQQGCDVYQGFLFSPALSAPLFEQFVEAASPLEATHYSGRSGSPSVVIH
jgi:diguanylate cyclase (GGDEF)-like protein